MPTHNSEVGFRGIAPKLAIHSDFWINISAMCAQDRIAQAMLLISPPYVYLDALLERLLATLLCCGVDKPCGICGHCSKVLQNIHPDVLVIQPERSDGAIKIDQIRELQQLVYQSPQLGTRRLVLIKPVEALNNAAASALLKILEEPPPSTVFILVTAQPSLLLPTLLSRCQKHLISQPLEGRDLLSFAHDYQEILPQATLFTQRFALLSDLDKMLEGRSTPCELSALWAEYPLQDLLLFLYALIAKLIEHCLRVHPGLEEEYQAYLFFGKQWQIERLFMQLDRIQDVLKKTQQNIALNAVLAIEQVLIELYCACSIQSDLRMVKWD